MIEPVPVLRTVILEPVYLLPIDMVEVDAQPLLDDDGNPLRDDDGNIIYG